MARRYWAIARSLAVRVGKQTVVLAVDTVPIYLSVRAQPSLFQRWCGLLVQVPRATIAPERANGCGHDALLAQSLDNSFGVTHMPTTRQLRRATLAVSPDIATTLITDDSVIYPQFPQLGPGCTLS